MPVIEEVDQRPTDEQLAEWLQSCGRDPLVLVESALEYAARESVPGASC